MYVCFNFITRVGAGGGGGGVGDMNINKAILRADVLFLLFFVHTPDNNATVTHSLSRIRATQEIFRKWSGTWLYRIPLLRSLLEGFHVHP